MGSGGCGPIRAATRSGSGADPKRCALPASRTRTGHLAGISSQSAALAAAASAASVGPAALLRSPPQLGEFAQLDRVGTVGTRNRARAGGRLGGLSSSSPPPPRRLASFESECCSRPLPSHLRRSDQVSVPLALSPFALPSCPLSSSGFSFPVPALLRPRAASPPRFHPRHP